MGRGGTIIGDEWQCGLVRSHPCQPYVQAARRRRKPLRRTYREYKAVRVPCHLSPFTLRRFTQGDGEGGESEAEAEAHMCTNPGDLVVTTRSDMGMGLVSHHCTIDTTTTPHLSAHSSACMSTFCDIQRRVTDLNARRLNHGYLAPTAEGRMHIRLSHPVTIPSRSRHPPCPRSETRPPFSPTASLDLGKAVYTQRRTHRRRFQCLVCILP
jgi:hypothetical protein